MPSMRVTWEIDIDAETPEDAARQALAKMRDRDSLATVFDVDGETIDLNPEAM